MIGDTTGSRIAAQQVDRANGARLVRMAASIAVVVTVCLLFAPTIAALRVEWTDTTNLTYTHGYLVCAVTLWLLLRAAREQREPVAPDLRFAALLVLLGLAWLLALRAGIELLHQVLFPAILLTALCAFLGFRNGWRHWFGCAFLYFAIPVWTLGTGILQAISTFAVKIMLALTGVPAHVDGNIVHIPEGAFEIAGGCSGVHYFIVSLALATVLGEIHHDSFKIRVRLVVMAAVLACVANWVRIYVVIVAGHLTAMQHYLVRVDHYLFGWALYAVSMGIFLWLASRAPAGEKVPAHSPPGAAPSRPAMASGILVAFVAAALGPALGMILPVRAAQLPQAALLGVVPGWDGPATVAAAWRPDYDQSDRRQLAEYRRAGGTWRAFVAEYDIQRQGKELVGFDNSLLAGLPGDIVERSVSGEPASRVLLRVQRSEGRSHVVAYYYDIGGQRRTSDLAAQLTYGIATLAGPVLSRVVAVEAECGADCTEASAGATELLRALYPLSENGNP